MATYTPKISRRFPFGSPPPATPVIAGQLAVGQLITGSARAGGVSSQWQRDGVDIVGATGQDYTLTSADRNHVITRVDTNSSGSATSNPLDFSPSGYGWTDYRPGQSALYSGGYNTSWPATIAPAGVTPTLTPSGGNATKPLTPRVVQGTLTGPLFHTQLGSKVGPVWDLGAYLQWLGTLDASGITEFTQVVCMYPNMDVPTGVAERQEVLGFNVAGGGSEPRLLSGYPGTGLTTVAVFNGGLIAWEPFTKMPQTRFCVMVLVGHADGTVDLYFNGEPVRTIANGWTPGVTFVNEFLGAAWASGTTTMSAPIDATIFFCGNKNAALSSVEVGGLIDVSFNAAGREVTNDWWPTDDVTLAEFLDLGGKDRLRDSLNPTAEKIVAWQGRDVGAQAHTTPSEARAPTRGWDTGNLMNGREVAKFIGTGLDPATTAQILTCGNLTHILGTNNMLDAYFACRIPAGSITLSAGVGPAKLAGYLGQNLFADSGGTLALSFVKDPNNLYGFGANALVARFMIYSTGDNVAFVQVYEDTDMIIQVSRTGASQATGVTGIRVCDTYGKRSMTYPAINYTPGAAVLYFNRGYGGSASLNFWLSRFVLRPGTTNATFTSNVRAWCQREYAIDCS